MGREVRKVPADWSHPKDSMYNNGQVRYIALLAGPFSKALTDWNKENDAWQRGFEINFLTGEEKPKSNKALQYTEFSEWYGPQPIEANYMPEWSAETCTHYMMYETTSEGTPISPAFATPEELARWLTDNGASAFGSMTADYEHWLWIANGGFAPSIVATNGHLQSGVQALD